MFNRNINELLPALHPTRRLPTLRPIRHLHHYVPQDSYQRYVQRDSTLVITGLENTNPAQKQISGLNSIHSHCD
jgi:hypothetical protein